MFRFFQVICNSVLYSTVKLIFLVPTHLCILFQNVFHMPVCFSYHSLVLSPLLSSPLSFFPFYFEHCQINQAFSLWFNKFFPTLRSYRTLPIFSSLVILPFKLFHWESVFMWRVKQEANFTLLFPWGHWNAWHYLLNSVSFSHRSAHLHRHKSIFYM